MSLMATVELTANTVIIMLSLKNSVHLYTRLLMAEEESVQVEEGPLPVLKWDQGLFEQITRGFRFPPEWDARYPR
ncbi:hypothetical protein Hanom_Chr15g01396201 [Helianthus anomalus]